MSLFIIITLILAIILLNGMAWFTAPCMLEKCNKDHHFLKKIDGELVGITWTVFCFLILLLNVMSV